MPGKPAQLRRRVDAKRAAKLRAEGFTNAEIAAQLGCPVDTVPTKIELGLRYLEQDGEPIPAKPRR